jgi:hypothetical protein
MRFQLVLQFRGDSLGDYDRMIALENRLIEVVSRTAKIDGHDCGSGETNIFIHTPDPIATFATIRPTLTEGGYLQNIAVAFRLVTGNQYTVLWPESSSLEFRVA